jgi:hypothetical protein
VTDLLRHFALLLAVACLWWAAQPTLDPRRIWARTIVPLTPEDVEAHRREASEREDRWEREKRWLARMRPSTAYWKVGA